jgi:RNA polymerase sigma factor (sigma-70 family)
MQDRERLAAEFEQHRGHLRAVAYRLLGSASDAEDAVQDTWLRLTGADTSAVDNLGGWLTTVVARVSLNMLRSRRHAREVPVGDSWPAAAEKAGAAAGSGASRGGRATDPEADVIMADSVGLALLVVLDALTPAERIAFVLHDMFAMPFTEVAAVLGRSSEATRQLASRARRRVHGAPTPDQAADLGRQREVATAFLAASRGGDFDALVAILDDNVRLTADAAATGSGKRVELAGAAAVARGALVSSGRAGQSQLALVDGRVGIVHAPAGRLRTVLLLAADAAGRITTIDVIADPDRLGQLRLAVLPD